MIRRDLAPKLEAAARASPSITLTGPRQSGKTTLCRAAFPQHQYETLEVPDVRTFATEDPHAFLARFRQGAIIDEVQRVPDLLSYLQGIIDADPAPGRWILTGSQNLSLLEPVSQSLAGRTASMSLFDGSRRVHRHLARSTGPCSVVVVYGGDQPQRRRTGSLIPWRELHEFDCIVTVRAADRPIAGANVLALFSNKTWKNAITDESGMAVLDLHSTLLSMTVFVAAKGFAAHSEHAWIPAEGVLDVELTGLSDGGAVIFPNVTGHVPILRGRLNPILDTHDRTYLYADNIAINGGLQQPVQFAFGEELHLSDAEGQDATVRIVNIVGQSALVQYQRAQGLTKAGRACDSLPPTP